MNERRSLRAVRNCILDASVISARPWASIKTARAHEAGEATDSKQRIMKDIRRVARAARHRQAGIAYVTRDLVGSDVATTIATDSGRERPVVAPRVVKEL
jgi:hypothetical protein